MQQTTQPAKRHSLPRTGAALFRSNIAKGVAEGEQPVSRTGGRYGAGMIEGFAVVSRGEASGHGLWIDAQFLAQAVAAINESPTGVKSRFMHPAPGNDGLTGYLGRTMAAWLDGNTVRADEHFAQSAHDVPEKGDLAGYLMDRADEDSKSFGASMAFEYDLEAMAAFWVANGGLLDASGAMAGNFKSPDPLNVNNLPHARLLLVKAVDIVDDPAANPNGLFSNRAGEAVAPKPLEADLMADEKKEPEAPAEKPVETPAEETKEPEKAEETPVETAVEKPVETAVELSAGKRFLAEFGSQGGVWFAEGRSYDEARGLYAEGLKAEVARLTAANTELVAKMTAKRGEASGVTFSSEPSAEEKRAAAVAAKAAEFTTKVGSPSLAKFAASIELPSKAGK